MDSSNKDFETYLILALIYNQHFRKYCLGKMRSEWLISWESKYLFDVMVKMDQKERIINFISVIENVKRDTSLSDQRIEQVCGILQPYIEDPSSPILQSMLDAVIPIVEEEIGKNLLTRGILKAQEHLDSGRVTDVFNLFEDIKGQSIYEKNSHTSFWNEAKTVTGLNKFTEWKRGVPLGIYGEDKNFAKEYIDQNLYYKGVGRGQIAMVVGLSSVGKSTLMLNIGLYQSLHGYAVNYYSLEMPPEYMSIRILSILTNIPTPLITERSGEVQKIVNETFEKVPGLKEIKLAHYKAHHLTPAMISQDLDRGMNEGRKVDSVIIDYADIMGSTRRFKERRHEIGYNIEELRDIGIEFNCSVHTASQSNREGFRKKKDKGGYSEKIVDRGNVAEDFSKVFTCDLLYSINSEIIEGTTIDGKRVEGEQVVCFVDKNRFGPEKFSLNMDVNRITGRFFDPFDGL